PATAGQDADAGQELAELAGTMAARCEECGITDCAELLTALHVALTQAPTATSWPSRFAAAALEAFGYVQHRIGALATDDISSPSTSGQHALATQLTQALTEGLELQRVDVSAMPRAAWRQDDDTLANVFTDGDMVLDDDAPPDSVELTEDERALVASFQSAPLRVAVPPPFRHLLPESPAMSAPGFALTDSGWAPGPADVLPEETSATQEPNELVANQPAWPIPTAAELDEIPEGMKRIFLVETEEDLQDLRLALLRYEQSPDDPSALHAIGRITHKIKGTAATLGFDVLAAVTHSYEDLVKALLTRRVAAGPHVNAALLRGLVLLQSTVDASNAGAAPNAALAAEAEALVAWLPSTGEVERLAPTSGAALSEPFASSSLASSGSRESAPPLPRSDEGQVMLHVEVRRLDELMRHLSALAVNRAALLQTRDEVVRLQSDMSAALARLNDVSAQITDLQPLPHQQPSGSPANAERQTHWGDAAPEPLPASGQEARAHHSHELPRAAAYVPGPIWDELELDQSTEFDSALRALNEVVTDVSTTSRQLRTSLLRLSQVSEDQAGIASRMQRDVMHVRLVPLSDIVTRLEFEAKVLAGLERKSVVFSVSGEMTEIDRDISEALREPLVQLVRNAVVHGIEPVDERMETGKTATGAVWVHAYYVGSEVIIEVGDDGHGVNPHMLAAAAEAAGFIESATVHTLSTAEALDLMFLPGISTFDDRQTDGRRAVSGRGIGLDEVRTAIQKLKGVISIRSEPGKGSVFRVRVPISLSIVHALHVLAGDQSFAVPFSSVERTFSLNASEMLTSVPVASESGGNVRAARPTQRIRLEKEETPIVVGTAASQTYDEIPVYALAPLLGLRHEPRDPQAALLVRVGRQRVVLLVDGVLEEQEVAVQTLPRPLQRRAVRGASVTADGQVLVLLDLPELAAGALDGSRAMLPPRPRPAPRFAETLAPRVLVVDDSVTIRQTLEHMLRRGGFDVQVARNGIEALEMMLVSLPRVLVLDIEMPRLDGFEMLSILRGSPQFSDVRVVMLTSRAADKHKARALQLGAQAYLIKPCPQETLLDTVRGLLAGPGPGMH
ncbi:MAG: hybrid sensor histidine kinase/response regulator, partial [Ktedonobacterales bacterium]